MTRCIQAVVAAVLLASCSGRQVAPLDPSCERGLEILESAETDQQMREARALFRSSCEKGCAKGCFHLAVMWERGMGGHEDQALALELLRRSCDLGESQACQLLSSRLKMAEFDGDPVPGTSAVWP